MKYGVLFLSLLLAQSIIAQSTFPVIKAISKQVAIRDGDYLDKNAWSLAPAARPDVFTADRSRKAKWVTFYTDIDSIRVKVKPGTRFDFIVLLNGKDSCYTQIASAIPPENPSQRNAVTHDTIPFVLTAYNAIQVKAVINDTDTLNLHFDVGSFDFRLTRDAILKKTSLLSNQPEALAGKATPNFNRLKKVFKVQLGNAIFTNPEIVPTGLTSTNMDGRFGWNLFEGKQVEINYDENLLIIHSSLPRNLRGYVKSTITFIRSFVCVKGAFDIGHKKYTGDFLFDTGSDQALIVDSAWAAGHDFSSGLPLIKSTTLHDPRGVAYETRLVQAPLFRINRFELTNVPTLVLGGKNPVGFAVNYLGNDLLKRFNIILDFKKDNLYLKPNRLVGVKYRGNA